MTEDQIIAGLLAYEADQSAKRAANPHYGMCGCLGKRDGEPLCVCAMRRLREQAAFILAQQPAILNATPDPGAGG